MEISISTATSNISVGKSLRLTAGIPMDGMIEIRSTKGFYCRKITGTIEGSSISVITESTPLPGGGVKVTTYTVSRTIVSATASLDMLLDDKRELVFKDEYQEALKFFATNNGNLKVIPKGYDMNKIKRPFPPGVYRFRFQLRLPDYAPPSTMKLARNELYDSNEIGSVSYSFSVAVGDSMFKRFRFPVLCYGVSPQAIQLALAQIATNNKAAASTLKQSSTATATTTSSPSPAQAATLAAAEEEDGVNTTPTSTDVTIVECTVNDSEENGKVNDTKNHDDKNGADDKNDADDAATATNNNNSEDVEISESSMVDGKTATANNNNDNDDLTDELALGQEEKEEGEGEEEEEKKLLLSSESSSQAVDVSNTQQPQVQQQVKLSYGPILSFKKGNKKKNPNVFVTAKCAVECEACSNVHVRLQIQNNSEKPFVASVNIDLMRQAETIWQNSGRTKIRRARKKLASTTKVNCTIPPGETILLPEVFIVTLPINAIPTVNAAYAALSIDHIIRVNINCGFFSSFKYFFNLKVYPTFATVRDLFLPTIPTSIFPTLAAQRLQFYVIKDNPCIQTYFPPLESLGNSNNSNRNGNNILMDWVLKYGGNIFTPWKFRLVALNSDGKMSLYDYQCEESGAVGEKEVKVTLQLRRVLNIKGATYVSCNLKEFRHKKAFRFVILPREGAKVKPYELIASSSQKRQELLEKLKQVGGIAGDVNFNLNNKDNLNANLSDNNGNNDNLPRGEKVGQMLKISGDSFLRSWDSRFFSLLPTGELTYYSFSGKEGYVLKGSIALSQAEVYLVTLSDQADVASQQNIKKLPSIHAKNEGFFVVKPKETTKRAKNTGEMDTKSTEKPKTYMFSLPTQDDATQWVDAMKKYIHLA